MSSLLSAFWMKSWPRSWLIHIPFFPVRQAWLGPGLLLVHASITSSPLGLGLLDVDVDALGFGLGLSSSISIASSSEAFFDFGLGLDFAILSLSSSYASLASAVEAGSCCGNARLHCCWALALSTRVVSGRSLEERGNDEPRPKLWFIFMTYRLGLPLLGPPASEPAHITLGRGGAGGPSGEFAVGPAGASSLKGRDA